jgi:aminopeptidase-like protein
VLDWTVPKEWNVRDAYVKDATGRRVIDFQASNLHLMSYSVPFGGTMSLAELRSHLFTLPEHPAWIPYRTSYYEETWGFCLADRELATLEEMNYEVFVDSSLHDGHLTYGEYLLNGKITDEILISCHICHPSLANDNLSGIAVATWLADSLARKADRRFSYRFLFIPGTIGSITWLALNERNVTRIRHGLTVACVGDTGSFTYKRSRRGNAEIDRAVTEVLRHSGFDHEVVDFSPYGYDERQYCSPGFDLPVGCLSRTPHGKYPEYHTSADDLELVRPRALGQTLSVALSVLGLLEGNATYVNTNPKGEPQLGKRGLYPATGGKPLETEQFAFLWVLNLSDARHSLLDIAETSGLPFPLLRKAADRLLDHGLLEALPVEEEPSADPKKPTYLDRRGACHDR